MVQMSEAVSWNVKPWEWQAAPEWWVDKIHMYLSVQTEVRPALEEKHRRRAQQQ